MSYACQYCESEDCDTDCYACARIHGHARPTAAELRGSANEELQRLRAMRTALETLRADIDGDTDCCSYTTEIDQVLAIGAKP